MKKVVFYFIILVLLGGCAKMVTPSGGPKDITPPKVLKALPENGSIRFNSPHIKLTFNEFVELNNPSQNVLFSPPLMENPDFTVSNKSVIIKIKDTLKSNTTYNAVFFNCIKDFTEGNLISVYHYTFSTGNAIDSFMIDGCVKNSKTLAPEKDMFVFLYDQDIDSLPRTQRPTYVTKTDTKGDFSFIHIRSGKYKLFALNDINSNLLFDLPNESVAFSDTIVIAKKIPEKDSVKTDSNTTKLPTTNAPIMKTDTVKPASKITLWSFEQQDTAQKLFNPVAMQAGQYRFVYKLPFSSFHAELIDGDTSLFYFQKVSDTKDTVTWYFNRPPADSLQYIFTVDNAHADTVTLSPFKQPRQSRNQHKTAQSLGVSFSNQGNIYKSLMLRFSVPSIIKNDFEVFVIKKKKNGNDTAVVSCPGTNEYDFSYSLPITFNEKISYIITMRDSLFYGINNLANDSLVCTFTTTTEKDYGNLIMNYDVKDLSSDYIIMLQNSKQAVLQTDILNRSSVLQYDHLVPGDYKIKVIKDENRNGQWDTGNYDVKRQPEKIFFFEKTITIRGFWDVEDRFSLE